MIETLAGLGAALIMFALICTGHELAAVTFLVVLCCLTLASCIAGWD